ncbi:MAG: hypothetical protein MUC69_00940 [Gemmatimonadales bacterium]|nr:hypothetical protein [Gemmatimonadales bacterium]
MLELLQRYYWAFTLLTIAACSAFAGHAAVHLAEGALLANEPAPSPQPRGMPAPTPSWQPGHSKETTAILRRNIFCSSCPPILDGDTRVAADDDDGKEIESSLPFKLVATITSPDPEANFAFVRTTEGLETRNARGQVVRVYPLSMVVPGRTLPDRAAVVERIEERRVYLKVNNHLEYLDIGDLKSHGKGLAAKAHSPPALGPRGPGPTDLRRGVRRISDTRFELDRSMLESVLANPNAFGRAARVVPSRSPRDGRPDGFKLYAIRPDSLYSVIGLQNGDTLAAINGQALDNPAKAFELYAKLRTASSLQLSVVRRGQSLTLDYSIR